MKKKLIIGIIGVGLTAHLRYYALEEIAKNRVAVKGAYSKTTSNLMNFSKEMSIKAFGSLEEILEDPDINTISINTPNIYHYEITKQALSN